MLLPTVHASDDLLCSSSEDFEGSNAAPLLLTYAVLEVHKSCL